MNRRAFLGATTATTAVLAGCTDASSLLSSDEDYDIGMTRNEFEPRTYETTVGETVVWKNTSGARHTITAYEATLPEDAVYFATGGYESEATARSAWEDGAGIIETRETFEHTFTVPGEIGYVCLPHEAGGMDGWIVVTE